MKRRYNVGYDRKTFNENLNPLKGWLRSCIGKKWDKCYSELRKKFDARSVVNNHILEHLYDYIQVHTKIIDGRVLGLHRWKSDGWVPVKELSHDYYVCPKDGTVKVTNKAPRRSIIKEKEAAKKRERDAEFRELDADTHLRLIENVWFVFTVKDLPEIEFHYSKPLGTEKFKVNGYGNNVRFKTWDELDGQERERYGVRNITKGVVIDALTGEKVHKQSPYPGYRSTRKHGVYSYGKNVAGMFRYYDSKATASHKLLKQAGIV
jgi:hypothetical protein